MNRWLNHILIFLAMIIAILVVVGCTGTEASGSPAPAPTAAQDLTNQNSPNAATFTTYPSQTKLQVPSVPVGLRFIAGGFTAPMNIASPHDGTGRLFLSDQTGVVKIFFMNGTVIDKPFLDIRDRLVPLNPSYDERGLLSIAFHPKFATNGRVFVYYSAPLRAGADPAWSCTNRLSEFHVSAVDKNQIDLSSEKILLEVDKPFQNHNGGTLLFGPDDGFLYLPLGDGGRADDTGTGHTPGIGNAQDMTKLLGKVIRIDVDSTTSGKQYGIPADNPFLSNTTIPPEIFAYGFRNPAYATFDSAGSHRMYIAMAGQRLFESVLIIYKGGAYPWNIREGTHCFDPANDVQPPSGSCPTASTGGQPLIGPVVELGHDVGDTVVGGALYRGTLIPAFQGSYVYGTWSDDNRIAGNGTLLVSTPPAGLDLGSLPNDAFAVTPAQNAMWTTRLVTVANNRNGRINAFIRGIGENDDHEILLMINQNGGTGLTPQGSGEIWQMVPADTSGLVSTTAKMVPAPTPAQDSGSGTPVTLKLTPTPSATAAGQPVSITLTAQNAAFSATTLTAPARSLVIMTFVNKDANMPHNFALYTDSRAKITSRLFAGDLVIGPKTVEYTFVAPSTPGNYFFRCDYHPELMTGTFVVT
jgi:glucose/arabinose dehydrogenase/plastocyanin